MARDDSPDLSAGNLVPVVARLKGLYNFLHKKPTNIIVCLRNGLLSQHITRPEVVCHFCYLQNSRRKQLYGQEA